MSPHKRDFPEFDADDFVGGVLGRTTGGACGRAVEQLADLMDDQLQGLDRQLVQAHLEHCTDCRQLAVTMGWWVSQPIAAGKVLHALTGLPVWVGLHTTTACNLKCVFCLQADGLTPRTVMDDDVFVLAANQLFPTAKVAQLTASGEPFLTPKLGRALDIMQEFGVKLEVITNGTLLNDRSVVRQAAEIADTFSFSIDGGTAETFNALRIGADFHQVMENIRAWNKLRSDELAIGQLLRCYQRIIQRVRPETGRLIEGKVAVGPLQIRCCGGLKNRLASVRVRHRQNT